jgi:hypothetical protein
VTSRPVFGPCCVHISYELHQSSFESGPRPNFPGVSVRMFGAHQGLDGSVFTLVMFGSIKTNPGAIAVSAVHLNMCEVCHQNPVAHQISGPRPLKRWVLLRFQTKSGTVRMIYERNTNQIQEDETLKRTECSRISFFLVIVASLAIAVQYR